MGEIQLLGGKYGQQVRSLNTGRKLLRTKFKVPKMIDLNYGTSLIVYNPVGEEIQLIPKSRVTTVRNKRWTGKELYCYLDNNYLFIEGPDMIHYATISGVFEDPFELVEYGLWSSTAKFPLPMNLIPTLKQMIFANDLRILLPNPIDQTNDNVISLSPPSDGPANYVPRTYPGPAGGINAARAAAVGPGPERNNEIMPNGYRNPKII